MFNTFVKAYKVWNEGSRFQGRTGYSNYFRMMEEKTLRIKDNIDLEIELIQEHSRFTQVPETVLGKIIWGFEFPVNFI